MWRHGSNEKARQLLATAHTAEMEILYNSRILHCTKSSIIFDHSEYKGINKPCVVLEPYRILDVVCKYGVHSNTIVVNIGSYNIPGNNYYRGKLSQEGLLCGGSILFNVLSECSEYYDWNRNNLNRELYHKRVLYTPDVLFGEKISVGVLTTSVPNRGTMLTYGGFSDKENNDAIKERADLVLKVASSLGAKTIILSAFGCEDFAQDPRVICKIFKELLRDNFYGCSDIIFAIESRYSTLIRVFKEEFGL